MTYFMTSDKINTYKKCDGIKLTAAKKEATKELHVYADDILAILEVRGHAYAEEVARKVNGKWFNIDPGEGGTYFDECFI